MWLRIFEKYADSFEDVSEKIRIDTTYGKYLTVSRTTLFSTAAVPRQRSVGVM